VPQLQLLGGGVIPPAAPMAAALALLSADGLAGVGGGVLLSQPSPEAVLGAGAPGIPDQCGEADGGPLGRSMSFKMTDMADSAPAAPAATTLRQQQWQSPQQQQQQR
jgi:hypothetical protein